MNAVLLVRVWRFAATRLVIVTLATLVWGWLLLFFYSQFSDMIRQLANQSPVFKQLTNFGSGNLFTVSGAITLGTQHPLLIALMGIFAVGGSALAIAGERQAGTLEVLLARPILRRTYVLTQLVATLAMVALLVAALLTGMAIGAVTQGLTAELDLARFPLMWLNGVLLWGAFASFSLAVSASFDRPGPAIGLSLAFLLANYFLEILGSFWTDAQWSQEYSLFNHFQPSEILAGKADPLDFALLVAVILIPLAYALWVFQRRDLAAPA